MNWNSSWPSEQPWHTAQQLQNTNPSTTPEEIAPLTKNNLYDILSEDQLLLLWGEKKKAITLAKDEEMDLRKYIVSRAFPERTEGTNTKDLGNGYQLKANVKYNYKLADNDTVERVLDEVSTIGNQGKFIAERLVSWSPSFLLTEYRQLQENAEKGMIEAQNILKVVTKMLTIEDVAPELNIKEPKK